MVNISDRQVVDTGVGPEGRDYRVPEVRISGNDIAAPQPVPEGATESIVNSDISVPRNIEVESQTVRIQPDGSAVIDVLLSYEEADGATKHEVRLSRV
ncbi:MAG: hypothetical protein LC650_00980 [Actinobacteria bacterium]|nr:hypothetical protein [Actinomycetota bacterium]